MNIIPIRKTIFVLICASVAVSSFAMSHFAGRVGAKADEKNMKWSSTKWYNTGDFETKALPSKPGPNDAATLKWGSYSLDADQDVNVLSFSVGDDSKFTCKRRNFKVKRNLGMAISPYGEALAEFDDSNAEIGGSISYSFWDKHMKASYGTVRFIDSKVAVKNDLLVIIPSNGKFKNAQKCGAKLEVVGKTVLNFGGGAVVDSIIRELPNEWMLRIKIADKEGNVPTIKFEKVANLDGVDFEFDIKSAKPGKYPLVVFEDKKSGIGKPGKIILNGKNYSFGDEFTVDGKSARILLLPAAGSKDSKSDNDIVLEVSR